MYPVTFAVSLIGLGLINSIRAITEENGNSGTREIRDISYSSDCAAAELKVDKIDAGDREIKFVWKGKEDEFFGSSYKVSCYTSKYHLEQYRPYLCSASDIASLKKRKYKWKYTYYDSDYYCAVEERRTFNTNRRSNIVHVRTPAYTRGRGGIIGGLVVGILVFICIIIGFIICRVRRGSFPGMIFGNTQTTQPPVTTTTTTTYIPPAGGVQQPFSGGYPQPSPYPATAPMHPEYAPAPYAQPGYPPPGQVPPGYPPSGQVPPGYPPPSQPYPPWDKPPEYSETHPLQPGGPQPNVVGFKSNYVS